MYRVNINIALRLCFSIATSLVPIYAAEPDFTKPQTHLKLADAFADEGDYYRAITEYKTVIHLFPNYAKLDWVHFQIGRMYYEGGRFPQAKNELLPLTESKEARLRFLAYNFIALSYFENNEYSNARRVFNDLASDADGKPYATDYSIYSAVALAGDKKFSESLELMKAAKKDADVQKALPQYETFFKSALSELEKAVDKSPKSEFWATAFAILLPGSGHFFLREWDTGIVSLSLVGGAAFLAYDGFANDSAVQSILFTTFATGAYIGQAYSAYRTARKYNAELGDAENREIMRAFRSLNIALQFQTRF